MSTSLIEIPSFIKARLNTYDDQFLTQSLVPFYSLLNGKELFFFPDYTDHGINHINRVLDSIENLISFDTFRELSSSDVCVIVIATVLHDIGMYISPQMFKNLIDGVYDNIPNNVFKDDPLWEDLWNDYLSESVYWSAEKMNAVVGDPHYTIDQQLSYKISDPMCLTLKDRYFIGEFIKIHRSRLAYEIALKGYIDRRGIAFRVNNYFDDVIQLAGLVARSQDMNIRDTYPILGRLYGDIIRTGEPLDIKVFFLMILMKLSKWFLVDDSRVDSAHRMWLSLRDESSPYNLMHEVHLFIDRIYIDKESGKIVVIAKPSDAFMFKRIEDFVQDIQRELDISWSIMRDFYGNRCQLCCHTIITSSSNESVKERLSYVPKLYSFTFGTTLSKKLIAPLYADNPSYGIRELVQNAVDACRARIALDRVYRNLENLSHVTVSLDSENKKLSISDTGIGMTIEEIEKFFLSLGSSFDSSIEWRKIRDNAIKGGENMIFRTGRFGIGILSAFIIGSEIKVKTRSIKSSKREYGYQFTLRMDVDSFQIDKIALPEYGTTIEIICKDDAIVKLKEEVNEEEYYLGTNKWFAWYIGSKPKVEYYYNGKIIHFNTEHFYDYKRLSFKSTDFGNIYWKPELIFSSSFSGYQLTQRKPWLFCNEFFITNESNKWLFSIPGVEKFFPPVIPDLMFTDNYNILPLNIQRTNLEFSVEFSFEEELACAKFKDILCQLLAIEESNIKSYELPLNRNIFYNQLGYTYNQYRDYFDLRDCNEDSQYTEKCFYGKKIVHVYYGNDTGLNIAFWENLISEHPEAFFSFIPIGHNELKRIQDLFLRNEINHDLYHYSSVVPVLSLEVFCANYETSQDTVIKDISEIRNIIFNAQKKCHSYNVLVDDPFNKRFVNDLITQLECNSDPDKELLYVAIHNIKGNNQTSPLDDFIELYGDMIVPYNEAERREKFARLYEECGGEIERYRELYNESYFRQENLKVE